MKGFTKDGKFHPIKPYNKVRKAKDGKIRSILPKLELKLPERKESFSQISSDINRDAGLRDKLIDKNDALADKIESNPKSDFAPSRKEQLNQNNKIIKELNNDIKSSLRKLTKDERRQLPDEIKNLRRFLR